MSKLEKQTNNLGKLLLKTKFQIVLYVSIFIVLLASPLLFTKNKHTMKKEATVVRSYCVRKNDKFLCDVTYMFIVDKTPIIGNLKGNTTVPYRKSDNVIVKYDPKNPKDNMIDDLSYKQVGSKAIMGALSIVFIMFLLVKLINHVPKAGTLYLASTV